MPLIKKISLHLSHKRWAFYLGLVLLMIWEAQYIFTGNSIEWGDFSMFAQAYEAIRISVVEYGQFPWMNAWMAGGTPLYANPQIGVFSIQSLLSIIFGAPMGIKVSIIIYSIIAYLSMALLLRRYFKADWIITSLLSLVWILNSFFIAHLPSHYTFIWYALTPLFAYLALTFDKSRIGGALLGCAFGIMALSQIHNPFFHISILISTIILVRVVRNRKNLKNILLQLAISVGIFAIIAGHRLLYTVQNALEFPRTLIDNAATLSQSVLAFLIPYKVPQYSFINYPSPPFGWQEITAYIGVGTIVAFLISIMLILIVIINKRKLPQGLNAIHIGIIGVAIIGTFLIGLGAFTDLAPYGILKHLPVISSMRVSSRWFIFTILAVIIFMSIVYTRLPKSNAKLLILVFLLIGVGEMYVSNFGYQKHILSHETRTAPSIASSYSFEQSKQFGATLFFPEGNRIKNTDNDMPHFYREYEATTYNIGTIQANDSLIDLNTLPSPRCGYEDGCPLILSNNATVIMWSPNKIVLKRTSPGDIELNMNNSRYFTVNGNRDTSIRTVEAYVPFIIKDSSNTITIQADPSLYPFVIKK